MQFTKFTAVLALAASVSAVAIQARNECGNAIAVCKSKSDNKCHPSDPTTCKASGGDPYCCTTVGLLNVLNCVSLLNGDTISIPITLDIL